MRDLCKTEKRRLEVVFKNMGFPGWYICNRSGVQGSAFKGYRFEKNLYIFTLEKPGPMGHACPALRGSEIIGYA
jgi:hypothetical protein